VVLVIEMKAPHVPSRGNFDPISAKSSGYLEINIFV
jgi:hypothetical protein